MANPTQYGFRPAYTLSGTDVVIERVQAVSNPTTGIFNFDAVTWTGAGWDLGTAGTSGSVGSVVVGGAEYRLANGKISREPYLPSGTTYTESDGEDGCNYLYIVANLSDVVFEATVDAAIAQTDLELNFNWVQTTAGSTTNGLSGQQLTATSRAVTGTLQFRVIKFVERPRWDRTLAGALVYCMANFTTSGPPSLSTTGS